MKRIIYCVFCILLTVVVATGAHAETAEERMTQEEWRDEHGYNMQFYGTTTVDLTPISDYLTLLAENNIIIELPELMINHREDDEWIYSKFAENYYFRYVVKNDGSAIELCLSTPFSYRPKEEAMKLMMVSLLGLDYEKADELFTTLQYNVMNFMSDIKTDEYKLSYFESYGVDMMLTVTKYLN